MVIRAHDLLHPDLPLWAGPQTTPAGNPWRDQGGGSEASTQTTLCSPPHSIGPPPEQEEEHALWAASPRTVYSTFKRQGKRNLLQDMVVGALPVVDNLDKRRIESGKFEREQLKLLGHSKGTGVRWQIITKTKKVCLKRCKRPETKRRSETTMRPQ